MGPILFTHSYFLMFDPKQRKAAQPYPPLAPLIAAALLRQHGYPVTLFDTMFAASPREILPFLNVPKGTLVIYEDGFNYLTKMCLTNMRKAAFEMISMAKSRGYTVILSGSDSTDHYEAYLEHGADFIIIGEAEMTLLDLLNAIGNDGNPGSIPGLAFRTPGGNTRTAPRTVLRDLDLLPLPAWDLITIEPYKKTWLARHGYFSINVATTRGCPFKCNWCAKPIYGNRYNSRSPQSVVSELQMLKRLFQFDHVWFCDDIFGLRPGWVSEFAELVQQNNLRFTFKIQSRVDLVIQEKYTESLAKAGCHSVWMGAESGSQRILDAMQKGTRVEQIYQATKRLKSAGIRPCLFIQFGYLGETMEDIQLTLKMIDDLVPTEIGVSVSYPLPGTVFYEKVKKDLRKKSNWTDSDDLDLMFTNTYDPRFYRQLHRYVHSSFHLTLALQYLKQLCCKPKDLNLAKARKAAATFYYGPSSVIQKLRLNIILGEHKN